MPPPPPHILWTGGTGGMHVATTFKKNGVSLLHLHKDKTDNINLMKVANEVNERSKKILGKF